jgi:hypothetical protein
MSTNKNKVKEEKQPTWKVTPAEVPKTARSSERMKLFDDIINSVIASKETSFKVQVESREYRKLWSPLTSRIKEFNAKKDKDFILKLRTANKETFIVKEPLKK